MMCNEEEIAVFVLILAILFAILFSMLVCFLIKLIIWWRIMAKARFGGPLGLLFLVPFGQFILLCVLAFSRWPLERELEQAKTKQ